MTSGWRSRSPGPGPGSEGSEALPGPPGPAVDSEARRRCPGAGPAAAQGQHGQHVPEPPAALRLEARRQGGVPGASAAAVRLAGVGGPEVSPDLVQVPPRGGVVAGMLAEQPLDGAGLGPEAGLHLLLVGEACRQEAAGLHGPAGRTRAARPRLPPHEPSGSAAAAPAAGCLRRRGLGPAPRSYAASEGPRAPPPPPPRLPPPPGPSRPAAPASRPPRPPPPHACAAAPWPPAPRARTCGGAGPACARASGRAAPRGPAAGRRARGLKGRPFAGPDPGQRVAVVQDEPRRHHLLQVGPGPRPSDLPLLACQIPVFSQR